MLPNGPQLHLILNHLPIVGFVFLTPILVLVLLRGDDRLRKLCLMGTVAVALLATPAFLTGEEAEEGVEHLAGISGQQIHAHEESAELALTLALVTGGVALAGLIVGRSKSSYLRVATSAALLGTVVTTAAMAIAGHEGGKIRHPEISSAADSATGGEHHSESEGGDDD